MSLLEDRISQILELRISGLDDKKIAERLGLDKTVINIYERSTKKAIKNAVSSNVYGLQQVANKVGLSPIILDMFVTYHTIELPNPLAKHIEPIKRAIKGGAKSVREISDKIGLSIWGVYRCASYAGMKLPAKVSMPKKERIKLIREAIKKGIGDIERIGEYAGGLAPGSVRTYAIEYHIKLPKK